MDLLRIFLFFAVLATSTAGSGYNYQPTNQDLRSSAQFGNNVASVLSPPFVSEYLPQTNAATESSAEYAASEQFAAQPLEYMSPIQQQPVFESSGSALSELQYNVPQQRQTIISSNVYIHSAPEETEEIFADQVPIKKNYRLIFVKAPSYNLKLNLNSLKQAQAAHEEKTVIFVLAKKPDISNFQGQLSAIQAETKTYKPEVYFVKYKTQAEANRAQQEITAQYDAFGGSTSISNEGFAPVLGSDSINGGTNFVQSASNNQQRFIQSSFVGNQGFAPSLGYLPIKRKY